MTALLPYPDQPLMIEHKPVPVPVRVKPKTLKQYMEEKKNRKLRVGKRTPIRERIVTMMTEMSQAGIRYKTPRKLYGRKYNQKMWSGYLSYLMEQVRRVI